MRAKPPVRKPLDGKEYWRSLEELAGDPEFERYLEREFPDDGPPENRDVSRRSFLTLMGAAFAMGGLVGCRKPLAKILPYSSRPEDLVPGVPQQYATVWPWRGGSDGFVVESHEGRPTKIEGNRLHPQSLGATGSYAQAAVLGLYDPDRSQSVYRGDEPSDWNLFLEWARTHFSTLAGNRGAGFHVLCGASSSPSFDALRGELEAAHPELTWHTADPVSRDNSIEGSRIAFGRPLRAQLQFDQADVVVALGSDFLIEETNSVRWARDFARARRVAGTGDTMNRLYSVESNFTVTGAMADHRVRASGGRTGDFAAALALELMSSHGLSIPGMDAGALRASNAGWTPEETRILAAAAADLAAHRGRSILLAGESQPPAVHALLHAMNRALGNVGPVVRYTEEPDAGGHAAALRDLARALAAGSVDTLLVLGANPVYDAPGDLGFADALARAGTVVHLGLYRDETGARATWHLPEAHFLESWGDGRAWDGTASLQQPLIAPLYQGRSRHEVLGMILRGADVDGHEQLQAFYRSRWEGGVSESGWNRALHDGVIADTAYPEIVASPDGAKITQALRARGGSTSPTRDALEVTLHPGPAVYDGRFANSAWLQELPDPMTKITWDNVALMNRRTADALGVAAEDRVTLRTEGREMTLPVWILPGHADFCVSVALGYGRSRAGRVGTGVGVNAFPFRTVDSGNVITGVRAAPAGGTHRVATTQNHNAMEDRPLIREATLDHYREHPEFADHMEESPPLVSLYLDREYDFSEGNQWGMAVDLNTCTGCNACVTACQSENNIPTVGKDEVLRGREMHWIRLDRYYVGDEEDPRAVQQPVPCMQCENAPCESVCPVNATAHSDDGLNDMVYNRCIGTRYCSNNCPYKVRRFNFFDWNKDMTEVEKMGKNPDVTVRMRGIMEKCTYCVQRISRARIGAKTEGRSIADGDIVTACQQVCPTESIVFGDINDPESRVSRLKAQNRDYVMLKWLNTKPRTSYLARIRNPNPELEQA